MARINYVKSAQQRYSMVPVLADDGTQKQSAVLRKDGTPKVTKAGKEITRKITAASTEPLPMPVCGKCSKTIEVGQPYKWVKTKSGPYGGVTKYRCGPCPTWRGSELSSSKMAGVMAAQEQCDDNIDSYQTVDDFTSLAGDIAEQIRCVAQEYEESADNMVNGFGHDTSMSDELRERADALNDWADEIENTSFEDEPEEPEGEDEVGSTEIHDAWELDEFEPWRDSCVEALSSIVAECPV